MPERKLQRVLVAGGADFIGSNFVGLLLSERPEPEVWVFDKLTYAGNRGDLAEFKDQPGYRFLQGDICDQKLVVTRSRT